MGKEWEEFIGLDKKPDAVALEEMQGVESLYAFDCPCNPIKEGHPDYENMPYDFKINSLSTEPMTCPRCGRMFKLEVKMQVLMYTPLTLRYPGTDRMPAETLGLRDKE